MYRRTCKAPPPTLQTRMFVAGLHRADAWMRTRRISARLLASGWHTHAKESSRPEAFPRDSRLAAIRRARTTANQMRDGAENTGCSGSASAAEELLFRRYWTAPFSGFRGSRQRRLAQLEGLIDEFRQIHTLASIHHTGNSGADGEPNNFGGTADTRSRSPSQIAIRRSQLRTTKRPTSR